MYEFHTLLLFFCRSLFGENLDGHLLFEEQTDGQGSHQKTRQVCSQRGRQSVAGLSDACGTEVYTDGIKGGFGGAQHDGGSSADERIYPMCGH